MNNRKVPARYMSWVRKALRNSGRVVGNDITIPTSADSDMIFGISNARTLMRGLMATRTAYLFTTFGAGSGDILLTKHLQQITTHDTLQLGGAG